MFDITRTLSLDFLGDAWKECYLKFHYFSAVEIKSFTSIKVEGTGQLTTSQEMDRVFAKLEEKFIEGKAVKEGKVVEVKKEDLKYFPADVLTLAVQKLGSTLDADKKKA